jgi:Ca2+-binding EF-hand superfamily protein
MPAQSKAQQRFMGMVHAVQKGDMEAPSKEVEKAADSMTKKSAKDFASTSHKGLPNKKENMKITKERLKELVKEVMTEESEYQAFFQKALDKAGKGINDMNDAEKKAFFDKIDSAWNGKGEKNEELVGGQKELDVDNDGDIEADDLADLRASKNESVAAELPNATIPSNVKNKLVMAIQQIQNAKLNNTQKLQLVAQVVDSLGIDKAQLGTMTSKIRSKMESVDEARDANGNEFPEHDDVKAAVKKIIQNNDVEKLLRNKVIAYLQKEKGFTGAGNTNSSRLYDKVINDLLKH